MAASRLLSRFLTGQPRTTLRVNGLVKAMSLAREQLTAGIPASRMDEFRGFILRTLQNTEQICKKNHISPKDLPAPSYHAYQFLKDIDLQHLPVGDEVQMTATSRFRISNLSTAGRHVQQRMMETARAAMEELPGTRKQLRTVQTLIHQQTQYIQMVLKKKNAVMEDLPDRSAQMGNWLMYLDDNDAFLAVMEQLVTCCKLYTGLREKVRTLRKPPGLDQMLIEFTPMATLYRWRFKDGAGTLSMHPGFVTADETVLEAILASAVFKRTARNSLLIRQSASSPAFKQLARQLDGLGHSEEAIGQTFDLNQIFEEINRKYFKNRCQPPKLKWSTRFSQRKYGMYLPSTDTVVVSLRLDHPTVPHYVVDFIVYHELLHKILGMKETAKRQIAHTSEFRRREKLFEHYEAAQAYLEHLARSR